jgi:Flp pilus assembly protein TadG
MIRKRNFIKRTEGAAAIIIAIALFALIGVTSLAIDMGQLYTVRNQLQNVADAAALAGVGQLIQDQGGVAVWNSDLAKAAALKVAQDQGVMDGLPSVADGDRNDLNIHFGVWDIYAGNPSTAWTDLGTSVGSTSTANAMRVTITRGAGTIFGPVTSLFAQVLGYPTATIAASATAYLGYTSGVPMGAIQVPLALPSNILTASNGRTGWFARLFGPREAAATTTKTLTFKDTGGANVTNTVPTSPVASLDSNQGYWYTAKSTYSVPNSIKNILAKVYTPSLTGTSTVPVYMDALSVGQQIYPRSEYPWGKAYIAPIFQNLQKAYNYKTTGSATTAPPAGTAWRTTLAVHGLLSTASLPRKAGFLSLARLLSPFGVSEAWACATISYPKIEVSTFVNVDITGVTYTSSCDDCSYTFPKAISGTTYANKKDCLTNYGNSVWNTNSVTIKNVVDASTVTVSPTGGSGSLSGGPSNNTVNPGAPTSVGAFATVPRLVK